MNKCVIPGFFYIGINKMYRLSFFAILFIGVFAHAKAQERQQLLDEVAKVLFYGDVSDTAVETLEMFAEEVPEVYDFAQIIKNKEIDYNDSVYNATVTRVREYAENTLCEKGETYIRLLLLEIQVKNNFCQNFTLLDDDYKKILDVITASDLDVATKEKWRMLVEGVRLANVRFVQGSIQLTHHFGEVWTYLLSNPDDMSLEYLDLFCWLVNVLCRGDVQPFSHELPQLYAQASGIADAQMLKGSTGVYEMDLNYYFAMVQWDSQGEGALMRFQVKPLVDYAKSRFGDVSVSVANGYMALSVIEFVQGYKSTALSYLEKTNDIISRLYDEYNVNRLSIEMNMASLCFQLGDELKEIGDVMYRDIYAKIETRYGTSSDIYYDLMFNMFETLWASDMKSEAIADVLGEVSPKITENISGKEFKDIKDVRLAILFRRCAGLYKMWERNDNADFMLGCSIGILSEMAGYELELAESLWYMGNLKSSCAQDDRAAEMYSRAADIFRINDYRQEAIEFYSAAFDCYRGNNRMDDAVAVMETIEAYFPEAMNTYDYLTAKATSLIEDEPAKAMEYLNRMLELSTKEANEYMEAQCYSYLGLIYNSRYNNAQKALELYEKSLAIYQKTQEQYIIDELTSVYMAMSTIYMAMSDFGNAKKYVVECVEIYERNNVTKTAGYFNALIYAANYFKHIGSIGEMMLYISKANIVGTELVGIAQDQVTGVAFCCRLMPLMVHIYRLCNSNPQIAVGFNNSFVGLVIF